MPINMVDKSIYWRHFVMIIYDPETQYPKGTPFTYKIGWTELNIFYYGVRFRKNCHPDDLWTKYFSSSTPVKEFRKLNGEPDIVKVDYVFDSAEEARVYEFQFLKENNCVHDPKWLNLGNGGEDFCCLGHSDETKRKMADAHRGIPLSEETKQKMRKPKSAEHIKNAADARRGIPKSAETRQKIADANRGKTLSDETKRKMRKPKSAEHIKNAADAKRGKPQSPETIQKREETRRRNKLAKLQTLENCF